MPATGFESSSARVAVDTHHIGVTNYGVGIAHAELLSERTNEDGLKARRAAGIKLGRKPCDNAEKLERVKELLSQGRNRWKVEQTEVFHRKLYIKW